MISSIKFLGSKKSKEFNKLEIAVPSKEKGTISIICGKNHSGKTYIVKRIHRSITQRNKLLLKKPNENLDEHSVDNITCYYREGTGIINSPVLITRIANITELIKSVSVVLNNNHKSRMHLQRSDNYDRIQIKEGLETFTHDCFKNYAKIKGFNIDSEQWNNIENIDYRVNIMKDFPPESLFKTPEDNPVVKIFEELTKGKIYFGVNSRKEVHHENLYEFELRLAFDGDIIIPSGAWSEGQKVLFSILLLIYYKKPDVLIIDEIENHLHPEYISSILSFIKVHVSQTIITTHHPHIIFSRHADIVNYLEFEKNSSDLPNEILNKSKIKLKRPKQHSVLLSKNYSKLISTYKLFDSYDNQLLRISSSNLSDLNELLVDIFTKLFTYEVIDPNEHKKPDLQSQKLYDIFEKKTDTSKVKVLEFGAGRGRLLVDINKIKKSSIQNKFFWSLYEPYEEARNYLKDLLLNHPLKENISIFEIKPLDKFDFIIIPNVLHELTPNSISKVLEYCSASLTKDGKIIIVEIYPLLNPEKYAVPMSSYEWLKLTRKMGFIASVDGISFKNASHEAFFLQLSLPLAKKEFNQLELESAIKDFWNSEVLENRIQDYAGHLKLGDSDEIPKTLGLLCTISSILASNKGVWNSEDYLG